MAGKSFIPSTDAGVLSWSSSFSTQITATPVAFGLVAAQATAFAALLASYQTALSVVANPSTKTKTAVADKNAKRHALVANARLLAKLVEACPTVTDAQKLSLGLSVRGAPSPIPAPTAKPDLDVISVSGRTVRCRVHDGGPLVRRKPAGVQGVFIRTHVGPTQPADESGYDFMGSSTKSTFEVTFDSSVPGGSLVWIVCSWFNPRTETGPASTPVSVYLQGASGVVGA